MKEIEQLIDKLIKNSTCSVFEILDGYFTTLPVSTVLTKRQKFLLIVSHLKVENKLSTQEAQLLETILINKDESSDSIIEYDRYYNSFMISKSKTSLEKVFPFILMPFLVADSIEEVLSIKKDDVRLVKTKQKMIILFFKTSQSEYAVHIKKNVKMFEKYYKEYLLTVFKCISLFGKDEKEYSHKMRTLRGRVDKTLDKYISSENRHKLEQTKRTILSILYEDVRTKKDYFYFSEL